MRNLGLLLLAGCASTGGTESGMWIRTDPQGPAVPIAFETQKLHPRSKSVTMTVEGGARAKPPRVEAGEATVVYLYHYEPASAVSNDSSSMTVILVFDHVPQVPWRVELPAKGVEVLTFQERSLGGAVSGTAVRGWIEVTRVAERELEASLEVTIETVPAGTLVLGGRVAAGR
jgi:hypothetical protein